MTQTSNHSIGEEIAQDIHDRDTQLQKNNLNYYHSRRPIATKRRTSSTTTVGDTMYNGSKRAKIIVGGTTRVGGRTTIRGMNIAQIKGFKSGSQTVGICKGNF